MAFLRDICKALGVSVFGTRRFFLSESEGDLKQVLRARQPEQKGKKKNNQAEVNLNDQSLYSYDLLPFQASDIAQVYPHVKQMELINTDVRQLIQQGKNSFQEQDYERANEALTQATTFLLQFQGPANIEMASILSKMSSIHFQFGDFLQAIEL